LEEVKVKVQREDRNYKHVVRYAEVFDNRKAPTLNYIYIKRYAIPDPPPAFLEITIKPVDEK